MKYVLASILLFLSVTANAQRGHGERGPGKQSDWTPEQRAEVETKKLTLALDLSQAQQEQILAVQLESAKLRAQNRVARKAKRDAEERPSSEERFAIQNERLDAQIAYQSKMKQILTENQYKKWRTMKDRKGSKHGKNRKRKR